MKIPSPRQIRETNINQLFAHAKKKGWNSKTPNVFGKLMNAMKSTDGWIDFLEQTKKSYAMAVISKLERGE